MPYTVEMLPQEPILLCKLERDFSAAAEHAAFAADVLTVLDSATEPMVLIIGITEFSVGFEDLLTHTNISAKRY